MILQVTDGLYGICKFETGAPFPDWVTKSAFFSITRTPDELSIVSEERHIPANNTCERNWRALKVDGPLDFGLTGILSSLATPLAAAGVSIFAVSTFDTDYVLIKQEKLGLAVETLVASGHEVKRAPEPGDHSAKIQ